MTPFVPGIVKVAFSSVASPFRSPPSARKRKKSTTRKRKNTLVVNRTPSDREQKKCTADSFLSLDRYWYGYWYVVFVRIPVASSLSPKRFFCFSLLVLGLYRIRLVKYVKYAYDKSSVLSSHADPVRTVTVRKRNGW